MASRGRKNKDIYLKRFAQRMSFLLLEEGVTKYQVAKVTGIDVAAITQYINGRSLPDVTSLISLAKYFNCTLDYLTGMRDQVILTPRANEAATVINSMNKKEQDMSLFIVRAIKQRADILRDHSTSSGQEYDLEIVNSD